MYHAKVEKAIDDLIAQAMEKSWDARHHRQSFTATQSIIKENLMQLTPFCWTWLSLRESAIAPSVRSSRSLPRCLQSRY
jgi:hypothetical protein